MTTARDASPPSALPDRCTHGPARGRARSYTFAELVLESAAVLVGEVKSTEPLGVPPVQIQVQRSLPAGLPSTLRVTGTHGRPVGGLVFQVGESVVLFVCAVNDGEAALTGAGDTGKWPRPAPNWMFTPAHVQPLPVVVSAAAGVLAARDAPDVEARAHVLLDTLWPASPLGRIAALQLAAKDDFWDGVPPKGGIDRAKVAQLVGAEALLAPGPHDPAIDYAAIATLQHFPLSIAIPALIDRLDAADPAARDIAFSTLQTALLPLGDPSFGYAPQADAPARAAAIGRARAFWDGKRGAVLRREAPAMLAELEAPTVLRRRLAERLLRLLSGKDPGFDPSAAEADRKKAAQGFHDYWKAELPKLK